MKTVRFDSLPIGATFTHVQFGVMVFVKNTETTAIAQEPHDGKLSKYTPVPAQPVDVEDSL
jgi:hypothetical protein